LSNNTNGSLPTGVSNVIIEDGMDEGLPGLVAYPPTSTGRQTMPSRTRMIELFGSSRRGFDMGADA
jgi:hypothetical protein